MTDDIKYHCTLCGHEVTPKHGHTALWSRGYWWCKKHAKTYLSTDGQVEADFPSDGKLIPSTIMVTEE
jgi:hypothetical protein